MAASRSPTRLPPPQMVITNTVVGEKGLAAVEADSALPIAAGSYEWYTGDLHADGRDRQRWRNVYPRLLNWWASCISLLLSSINVVYCISVWRESKLTLSTGGLIDLVAIGFILSPVIIILDIFNAAVPACWRVSAFRLNLSQYAILHLLVCLTSVLPFSQGLWVMTAATLCQFIPAVFFYVARARREPAPAQALNY